MTIRAKVTAYKGILAIECTEKESTPGETHLSIDQSGVIGQVIMNTKETLGVSPEALEVLKTIPKGRDSIGDVDWWEVNDGTYAFGWLGGMCRLLEPEGAVTSRQYKQGDYVEIPNDVPEGAITAIDSRG